MNYKDIAREVVARNNDKTINEDNVAGFLDSLLILSDMVEEYNPTIEDIQEFINKGIMAALFAGWIDNEGNHIAYEPEEENTVWDDLREEYLNSEARN